MDFKVMVHRIHGRATLRAPAVFYGLPAPTRPNPGGTPLVFDTRMPRSAGECVACHVTPSAGGLKSWSLPLVGLSSTLVQTWDCLEDPSADSDSFCDQRLVTATKRVPPETAVCTSCHDQPWVVAHAEINTSLAGVESCTTCHGPGSDREAH